MRALVALGLASCVIRNDVTHVVLRDPMNVAVADILPIGSARGEIPATVPPYIDTPEVGSWVERDDDPASIVAWCPHCFNTRRVVIVHAPELDLDGSAADVLRRDGDLLHIKRLYKIVLHGRRFSYAMPRIALDLVTPRANVASIDFESHVQRYDGEAGLEISGMVWMGMWVAGGATLVGLGARDHEGGVEIAGGAVAAVGITALLLLVHEYRARDEHHQIAP